MLARMLHAARRWRRPSAPIEGAASCAGWCNVCGRKTVFFCDDAQLYREMLLCAECGTSSRYRSIARGLLKAMEELAGVKAKSVAALRRTRPRRRLTVYDTQVPFRFATVGYPVPEMLQRCEWVDLRLSRFDAEKPWGAELAPGITNQSLEALTFPDALFDLVITSDVMEHVRLDDRAHREIARVLKPGGVYIFTVPHFRDRETYFRVKVTDPDDPRQDVFLTKPEYHGDANAPERGALSYRSYGTDLDATLDALGLTLEYTKADFPQLGILNTELFYCRRR